MKSIAYLVLLTAGLTGCSMADRKMPESISKDTLRSSPGNSSERQKLISEGSDSSTTTVDSVAPKDDSFYVFFDASLFTELELQFDTISKNDFEKYSESSKTTCAISSSGFIERKDLYIVGECDETCEDFLVEKKSGKKIALPGDYDAGILGIETSPLCDKFIVYSSYDGPDYHSYYSNRAELFVFSITKDEGLKAVKPLFNYYSKDWSIENLIWISNHSIAIKIYEGNRSGDGSGLEYKFIKAKLNQYD